MQDCDREVNALLDRLDRDRESATKYNLDDETVLSQFGVPILPDIDPTELEDPEYLVIHSGKVGSVGYKRPTPDKKRSKTFSRVLD